MLPTIVFEGREYSPAWLQQNIARVQAGLTELGCREGDTVAAMLRNSPQYVAVVLACRLGGFYLASVNWHFKTHEARHILVDSEARALFIHDDLVGQVQDGFPSDLAVVVVASGRPVERPGKPAVSFEAFGDGSPPMPSRQLINHGAITYTSGTTGVPKGVKRTAPPPELRNQMIEGMYRVTETVYGDGSDLVAYLSAPIYHSAPMTYVQHFARLGARIVLERSFDPAHALALMARERVTHAYLVPTMYRRLLTLDEAERKRHDLSSLRHVASTGSPCPPAVKRAMIAWLGPVINEAYGSSEASYTTFINSLEWLERPGSAGRQLPNATVRILDADGSPLPPNTVGLIYVRQHSNTDFTYINKPQARRDVEREGLVTLGDMGYFDEEGYLFICDRQADMVISGGVNIYPAEIEAVLQSMPGIADCAVFGIPDPEYGEALGAAVQTAEGFTLSASDVQSWIRDRMANFKVPRLVEFHEALPREETGKIFKRKLKQPHWDGLGRSI
ncbi:AMP-binding protein [Variovorax sp. OV329]|uniref:AMP-binding protein n=1 Tax=Variovorax sp. OV329 TaxID=1882825 RepID=UPI0008EB92AE|nr:AMP-binding protein [Variovorax sp. OV329]SFM92303.1 long-chain acyl-CoA synthetase [Variovorax sp. OV329]